MARLSFIRGRFFWLAFFAAFTNASDRRDDTRGNLPALCIGHPDPGRRTTFSTGEDFYTLQTHGFGMAGYAAHAIPDSWSCNCISSWYTPCCETFQPKDGFTQVYNPHGAQGTFFGDADAEAQWCSAHDSCTAIKAIRLSDHTGMVGVKLGGLRGLQWLLASSMDSPRDAHAGPSAHDVCVFFLVPKRIVLPKYAV